MYIPKHFKNENLEEISEFIRHYNFGLLVSEVNNRPWATHIPFILNAEETKLSAHVSRGNIQWKHFNLDKEVLAVFQGPHAYISSSWYNHENVPTWNYQAVHVYGKLRIIEEDELIESLQALVNHHEQGSSKPVSVEKMSSKFLATEIRGIVAFEITITDLQASYKLSQNRDSENHQNIIKELEEQDDPNSLEIARQMKIHGHNH